jgi:hypothetical protein
MNKTKFKAWLRRKELDLTLKLYPFKPDSLAIVDTKPIELLCRNLDRLYNEEINVSQNINMEFRAMDSNLLETVLHLESLMKSFRTKKEVVEERFSFTLKYYNTFSFFTDNDGILLDILHYLGRLKKVLLELLAFFNKHRETEDGIDYSNAKTFWIHLESIHTFLSDLTFVILGREIIQ